MAIYSHSRLSTFEQCPLRFKYVYIEERETEIEESVEAFLGKRVHETLEKLYTDLKFQKIPTLQELLNFFNAEWQKNWTDAVKIVRESYSKENYKKLGEQYLTDYYNRYQPFKEDRTVALEKRILIKLDPYHVVQGYIDRLSCKEDGIYVIHDYKTTGSLPENSYIEEDRQLALYTMAVRQSYPDCKRVILVYHFLAFDKEFVTEKNEVQLEALRKDVMKLIDVIEAASDFPARMSTLCDWCEFQPECPQFKHLYAVEKKEANEFLKDDGVQLVNKYAHMADEIKIKESELEKIREALLLFAEKEGVGIVYGSDNKASINKYPKLSFPKKYEQSWDEFVETVKKLGLWEQLSTVDVYELAKIINTNGLHPELLKLLDKFISKESITRVYINRR
jgi:putative RecB family exonuclease